MEEFVLNPQRRDKKQSLISNTLKGLPFQRPGSPQTRFGYGDESKLWTQKLDGQEDILDIYSSQKHSKMFPTMFKP